ncbi:hypothetical protein C8A03DRAFT_30353 [Achaetomium macrosporum]|uniref:Nitrogen regulatory protein areA GATA-like domain-containing protein n=1 Tax=Achaetomium macrosporum TaxID=79813 RepID=A0AAN7CI28_9PEZI|nr:hypothetical protein C8A03DRAFT_30353 [Achaetomium macrosporum]
MPLSLEAPVLQIDTHVIHKVDTTNPANLFSMWTVFARCRESVAQGRRLENLSWRLWNRETFCCEGQELIASACASSATSKPQDIQYPSGMVADDLPQLSGSVDSVADEEAVDFTTESAPMDIVRPRIQRQDSCASSRSRGRERHITSDELEKMVLSIVEAKEPLNAPLPILPRSPSTEENPTSALEPARASSTRTGSPCETSENTSTESVPLQQVPEPMAQSRTIVTRGFSPSQIPVCRITSQASKAPSPSAIPEPTGAPAPKIILPKKQQAKFALGGSSGSDEESFKHDVETKKQLAAPPRTKMFQLGGSSGSGEDDSLQDAQHLQKPMPHGQKKTASFNNQVVTQTYTSSAISDTEDDYVDESAIDDDDEDWEEESAEESGRSSVEEKIDFKRVDSTAHLPSRRSLITLMLAANNTRSQRLGNIASQSTSALPRARTSLNGPSLVASPNDSDEAPLMMKRGTARAPPMRSINEIPRSSAQPINVAAAGMHYQAALSPRTTRRNMLATELTESLRRNLLRERSHKSSTVNAVLKRRHTSTDVANLRQYPERPFMNKDKEVDTNPSSWDQYFQNPFAGQAQAW